MLGDHCRRDNFVGREDILKTIDDHLLRPTSQRESTLEPNRDFDTALHLRSFAICGLGGIGKTELAIQYAHTRKQHFEAIFWLSADDSKILASNFANLAVQLGLEDDDSLDITASRDIVMGWLSKPLRKSSEPDERRNYVNWLLIFDNVDNLDVLADYWPKLGRGSVLITSRDPNAKQNIHIHHGLHLPPLTNTETEALMQQLTHVRVDQYQREALAKIAEGLDGLPLVVNQMSGLFRSFRLSYIDFLTFLQDEGIKKLYERQAGIMGAQKTQSLVTFWALDRLSAPTRALLQVICLLDPDDIPEDLLVDITCQANGLRYMFERGLQEETKPFCELSLQIAERMKSNVGAEAVECIRESHSFLGIALVETNEHSLSMNHKQKWLDMLLERPFKSGAVIEDYELGYAYNEIGVAYGNADRIEEAIDAFIRSIQIFQGLEDYEDIMLGWPEPNLGFMYWLKGDFDKAEQALVEILDIHASTWGVDDTNSFKYDSYACWDV
ncbi:hypothetical protein N0V84_012298 [Fusarium piperis]|uniref:DUF7779 domain-containing protein n=1 Tax=Fusarium piperis TaxID=1435070 RepID=A0A9W8TCT7_9HYPO|nr:hypothetical protein N0V84_012298 [Fusarium piperis]